MKQKALLIIFKGFSVAKNCLRPESAPLRSCCVTVVVDKRYKVTSGGAGTYSQLLEPTVLDHPHVILSASVGKAFESKSKCRGSNPMRE